ncbi:MAG: M36 family metallopeptidase [Planctomycetes bacterium]|nr:M36 family metallopeptidase [Planctomycetota bacterium]
MKSILFSGSVLAFGLVLAAPVRAQFDPMTLVTHGHAKAEQVPLSYYDVRLDEQGLPAPFVRESKRNALTAAQRRARAAEIARIGFDVPMLRTEEHEFFATPQWVGSTLKLLTPPSSMAPRDVVATFVARYPALFEVGPAELGEARIAREFRTDHSGATHLTWQQQVEGLDLVGCVLNASVTKHGELINVSSSFLPTPSGGLALPAARLSALDALRAAGANVGVRLATDPEAGAPEGTSELRAWSSNDFRPNEAVTTERIAFAWTRERLVPAYRVTLPKAGVADTYEVLVDATDGTILQRSNHTKYFGGTEDVSFRVYTSDSPAPGTPGPATPTGFQAPLVARSLVTVTGASVAAWSPNGWINDGTNETLGNNVDAHTDLNADNVADLPRPAGVPYRVFDFAQDNAQAPTAWRPAAVAQFFYLSNRYHDKLFSLGFNEPAKNFQTVNFSATGTGNDAVQADVQDGSGTNNANFGTTGTDGSTGRCQMFVFTGPTPDRDGDLDADIIYHELTHGTSIRLHNGTVNGTQSGGMGEGWSDFFGLCLGAEAGDAPAGNYSTGGYTTYQLAAGYVDNYYFGIRRFPYSTDLNKNPQTYADIDVAQQNYPPAIPRSTVIGNTANEVHNVGEVWCGMLWECRANIVASLGFPAGNDLIMQLVVDGMKLSVNNPSFVNARDAILQADLVGYGGAHLGDLWTGFAKRGLGFGAVGATGSTSAGIVESFVVPSLVTFSYPTGKPTQLQPGLPTAFGVDVSGVGGQTPTPGTGQLQVSVNGGAFAPVAMTENTPNHYTATLPASSCFDQLRWYVTVGSSSGTQVDPAGAPGAFNSSTVYTSVTTFLADDFETNQGWTVGAVGDAATTGVWLRADPVGTLSGATEVQPENDHTNAPGVQCYFTGQGLVGGATGTQDVDGGRTTLTTPVLNLSSVVGAKVSYWRWYSNNSGAGAAADTFRVDISADNGANWVNAETVGPTTQNGGGWIFHEFDVSSFITPTATVRVRFVAEDIGTGSVVEAAIDDFLVTRVECVSGPVGAFCAGDGTLATACPCGNNGTAGRGCANSVNAAGAVLAASGTTNPDTMVLTASGMPLTVSAIFLQGSTIASSGIVFGDGVRCVDGTLVRLGTKTNVGGASQYPDVGDPLLSVRGGVTPGSGVSRAYQTYYRNSAAGFCPPETFNVTNGWALVW